MKCGACGKAGLRTTTLAAVLEKGKIVGKRVGACCEKDGILLVRSVKTSARMCADDYASQR